MGLVVTHQSTLPLTMVLAVAKSSYSDIYIYKGLGQVYSCISLPLVLSPIVSTLHSGPSDSPEECQCVQSARTLPISTWNCAKFTLENTSSKGQIRDHQLNVTPAFSIFVLSCVGQKAFFISIQVLQEVQQSFVTPFR